MIGMPRGLGDAREVLDDAVLVGAQARAVIGRHQHQHLRAGRGRRARALGGDARAEMAAR